MCIYMCTYVNTYINIHLINIRKYIFQCIYLPSIVCFFTIICKYIYIQHVHVKTNVPYL